MAVNCPICGGPTKCLLDMPKFPITEKMEPWEPDFVEGRWCADQSFHYCESCSHGTLGTIVPDLYGSDYMTTTAKSEGATQAVKNFHAFINESANGWETVIDIGANDYSLLNLFQAEHKLAVDHCINGVGIEDADLSPYKDAHKLIVSSHTIEHLTDPELMIRKCAAVMRDDDCLALQFPSLERLVSDARIDQIHHQHVHYFSQRSICKLLARHGLNAYVFRFDDTHWGALQVLAYKGVGYSTAKKIPATDIHQAIAVFREEVESVVIPKGALALGAALMLPVLAYWMPELKNVELICDDDRSKDGMRFVQFNKPIGFFYDVNGEDVVISAIGSKSATRSLVKKAMQQGARRIILPLHTI